MLKKAIVFGIGISLAISLFAESAVDFKTAMGLYNQGKYREAQEMFVKVADAASTPQAKADCLFYAAFSLNGQKKYDEAVEMAKKIEIKPVSIICQMSIMGWNGKFNEFMEAFKDEDINAWPESYRGEGFFRRGYTYNKLKNTDAAVKDLEKSAEYYSDERAKMNSLSTLAIIYESIKDDQKALDTYQKIQSLISIKGTPAYNNAIISRASILKRQGKFDEALIDLQKIDTVKLAGDMKFLTLKAFGEIYEAQGKNSEAVAKYKEAVAVKENVPPAYVEALEKKISSMSDK
jgi:tetratricopeptide (TPR) repeat protein